MLSPHVSATQADNTAHDKNTCWVMEAKGEKGDAVVYTTAVLKRAEQLLMSWVVEADKVRVENEEEVSVQPVWRALEAQMGKAADDEEATGNKE